MQTHKEKKITVFKEHYELSAQEAKTVIELLDKYLPGNYTEEIRRLAKEDEREFKGDHIRQVRSGRYKNLFIFQYLLQYASASKNASVAAKQAIKANMPA